MPWNGSGVFTRLYSWVADKNAGIDISSSRTDADTNDIVTGLENTVTLDGQTVPVHSLPMGGFTHTNVGNATLRTNYAAAGQVVDGALVWGGVSGGTANAQTIAITPAVTALVQGQTFGFLAGATLTNTGAATLTVNATAATAIRKPGSTGPIALSGSEIVAGNTYTVTYDGTYFILDSLLASNSGAVLRGYIGGLALSAAGGNGTFGTAVGQATDSTNVALLSLTSAFTKTTSSWAVGSGNGGLDTGAIAPSTWYHAHLIQRVDTGLVDVLCSLSPTSPTLPTSYSLFRRIGGILTDSSSHWAAFTQVEETFFWATQIKDIDVSNLGTTAALYTLTVPSGVKVRPLFRLLAPDTNTGRILVTSPDETDVATGTPNFDSTPGYSMPDMNSVGISSPAFSDWNYTNTSAQIRARASAATQSLAIFTRGWVDSRGRFA